jgi:hypothetical protein
MTSGICVAAFDIYGHKIVRPLPRDAANWSRAEYTSGRITVGSVLGIRPLDPQQQSASAYPHATEDLRLAESPVGLGNLRHGELVRALGPTVDRTVSSIFDGNLLDRKYVQERAVCRSLGAVMIPVAQIRPYVDGFSSLRVTIIDQPDISYVLPITDMEARQIQATEGAQAAAQQIQEKLNQYTGETPIMVRLGLARAWSGVGQDWYPLRCYLQCNGFLYP